MLAVVPHSSQMLVLQSGVNQATLRDKLGIFRPIACPTCKVTHNKALREPNSLLHLRPLLKSGEMSAMRRSALLIAALAVCAQFVAAASQGSAQTLDSEDVTKGEAGRGLTGDVCDRASIGAALPVVCRSYLRQMRYQKPPALNCACHVALARHSGR